MSELSNLPFLIANSKVPVGRKRRLSEKIIRRHLKIVEILNSPYCQLLKFSHMGKILKVSERTVKRDVQFLIFHGLIFPLREQEIPFIVKETANEYVKRFLAAHGVDS